MPNWILKGYFVASSRVNGFYMQNRYKSIYLLIIFLFVWVCEHISITHEWRCYFWLIQNSVRSHVFFIGHISLLPSSPLPYRRRTNGHMLHIFAYIVLRSNIYPTFYIYLYHLPVSPITESIYSHQYEK